MISSKTSINLDALLPQMLTQFPQMIATMQSMRTMMLTMHSTMSGIIGPEDEGRNPTAMGKAFDAAKNDDSFYLPPEVFKNADFQRIMKIFLSPDGKAARMLISQSGDPATPEGIVAGRADKDRGRGGAQGNSARRAPRSTSPAPRR